MKWTRFERKILVAIVVAAVTPLVGALVLGQSVLREAYEVGVNERVRGELERSLSVYREHFVALRRNAEQVATAITNDAELRRALTAGDRAALALRLRALTALYASVARIRVLDASGAELAHALVSGRAGEDARQLDLRRPQPDLPGSPVIVVTVSTPGQPFVDYQRAGEVAAVFRRLEQGRREVAGAYLLVYMGFLLSVIVIALAVGIVISRRVTRRVSQLADATRKVGAGDLRVQVPTDLRDEIGELTRDFNEMVRDLRESRGRIEYLQRISAWQEFARRLAHEIKNPLTPIQLAIQELERGYTGGDEGLRRRLRDARAIIEEEVATLRRLTTDFSAFAKLPEATLAPADLGDFLREGARSLAAIVDEVSTPDAPVTLRVAPVKARLPVRIDAMMLKLGLDNLVRNAAQALRDHDGERVIAVRALAQAEEVVLEVEDSGPGIAAADRQRIFDPYFTTKAEGTGLGLPIVKKIVLEHQGTITCTEAELGGVAFRIHLPTLPWDP